MKNQIQFDTTFESYYIETELGEGGSGKVYKVRDKRGQSYALKYLKAQNVTKDKMRRFKNELVFCFKNNHPNIVKALDWGYKMEGDVKCPFYVMPYFTSTLRELMKKSITHNKILHYFSQILDGVEAAHLQKTWHRDLKPENILYDSSFDLLVITDWGIAHFSEEILHTKIQTKPQQRLANFQYAAPEQRIKDRQVDQRADIYALGMILNEIFTGILLQGTGYKTIAEVNSDYEYLDELVTLMTRQSPSDRLSSIDIIKKELIAKSCEFIARQKLSKLNNSVVSLFDLDDPLVNDPVKLVAVDYDNGKLIFTLSQPVHGDWVHIFKSINFHQSLWGKDPSKFSFSGNTANIPAEESQAQKIANDFKRFIELANVDYEKEMRKIQLKKEQNEKRKLQEQIEEEEKRQRILKSIKI